MTVDCVDLATVVATAVVAGATVAVVFLAAVVVGRAACVVGVVGGFIVVDDDVVVAGWDVVDVVDDVGVARSGSVVLTSLSVRRIGGSLLRCGTPAIATPTSAHTTSMSAVIECFPGVTSGPSRS